MASDGESAVLQVESQAHGEESSVSSAECSALASESQALSPAPLLMEVGQDIAVKVDAPMKQLSTLETYVTYRVRCACARWPQTPPVRRRYNNFKTLRQRLVAAYPLLPIPPLPPLHSARQQLDRYAANFVTTRTQALDAFLNRVAKHPILTHSEDLRSFLTMSDEEFSSTFKSEGGARALSALWGLTSALYGSQDKNPQPNVRVREPELGAAAEYLQSLQQKLTTLNTLSTRLHKDTTVLARELTSMKPVLDSWSSHESGAVARSLAACGVGAGAAAAARGAGAGRSHRARLPLLAAYAAVVRDKILERDALHASYASAPTNSNSELHNRLEQASEALRSELADWTPKTRSEIKSLLIDLAEKQVRIHQKTLLSWENALQISKETPKNVDELFKTVSKTAVQNLSPSKGFKDFNNSETEKDLDNEDFDLSNDFLGTVADIERGDSMSNLSGDLDDGFRRESIDKTTPEKIVHDVKNIDVDDVFKSVDLTDGNVLEFTENHINSEVLENDSEIAESHKTKSEGVEVKINRLELENSEKDVENILNNPESDRKQSYLENVNLENSEYVSLEMNSENSGVNAKVSENSEHFSDPLTEMAEVEGNI